MVAGIALISAGVALNYLFVWKVFRPEAGWAQGLFWIASVILLLTIVPISGEPIRIALHGGFLQIFQNEVTLLTDRAEISQGDADEARELAAQFAAAEDDEV